MTTELTPVSILSLMNSNKAQRKSFCLQIIEQVENGLVDPLQVHVYLKNLEAIFKTLTDEKTGKEYATRYKSALMDAAEKQGGKSFDLYNAGFQIKEAGTKYDFSKCNANDLLELYTKQEELNAEIEKAEKFLKALPIEGIQRVDENGEVVMLYPPSKTSTTTVSVTLK